MKKLSQLIILSFLVLSCEKENSVEPLVCDEGLTNVDGVCSLVCDEGLTNIDGECTLVCDEGLIKDNSVCVLIVLM